MNKLFKGVMLVCFFTLFSCQQDEMLYSCDPEVNEYIKSNLSDIQTMSRNRFLEIERDLQPSILMHLLQNKNNLFGLKNSKTYYL